jgi:hypothetical protein
MARKVMGEAAESGIGRTRVAITIENSEGALAMTEQMTVQEVFELLDLSTRG